MNPKHCVLLGFSPDLDHGHPGFDPAPDVGADLSVSLRCLPKIAPHLLIGTVQRSLLLAAGSPRCTAPERFLDQHDTLVSHYTPSGNKDVCFYPFIEARPGVHLQR